MLAAATRTIQELVYIESKLYVIPRTVYFVWICLKSHPITLPFGLVSPVRNLDREKNRNCDQRSKDPRSLCLSARSLPFAISIVKKRPRSRSTIKRSPITHALKTTTRSLCLSARSLPYATSIVKKKIRSRSTIIDQRSAINDQRSAINDQRSAINDQRSTISNQRSKDRRSLMPWKPITVPFGSVSPVPKSRETRISINDDAWKKYMYH